jgi:sirohydrochlorin cobaltochelatase
VSGHAAAVVLFAHGSRDPQWAQPFRAIQRKVSASKPALAVELAFLEMMEPDLPSTIERLAAAGTSRISIAPLFMAQGAHVKRDLARLLSEARRAHPAVEIVLLAAAGEGEPVQDAISTWISEHA